MMSQSTVAGNSEMDPEEFNIMEIKKEFMAGD